MYYPYQVLSQYKASPNNKFLSFPYQDREIRLIPVYHDDNIIENLAYWRDKFYCAFPARFKVTIEGTAKWLDNQVINNQDRMLFMIKDKDELLGHIGLFRFDQEENCCEIDNVVKGASGYPGLMTIALESMIRFVFEELKLSALYLRVFSDNLKAINLYLRCDFKEVEKIPLIKEGDEQQYTWVEVEDVEKAQNFFSVMKWCGDSEKYNK